MVSRHGSWFLAQQMADTPGKPREFSRALFFSQAEDGIRYWSVTGVQTCALPIYCTLEPKCARWSRMASSSRHSRPASAFRLESTVVQDHRSTPEFVEDVTLHHKFHRGSQIGRASCRERV